MLFKNLRDPQNEGRVGKVMEAKSRAKKCARISRTKRQHDVNLPAVTGRHNQTGHTHLSAITIRKGIHDSQALFFVDQGPSVAL